MLLVLFSLHGVTFESLALSAFGSSCWLWELLCIDFEKKTKNPKNQKTSYFKRDWGKGLEIHPFDTHPLC